MSRAVRLSDHARRLAGDMIEALYPPVCIACGAATSSTQALCAACWRDTGFIAPPVCDRCGAPVETDLEPAICDACVHAPPAFDRGRAAVIYDGIGRDLALKLKHADRLDIAAPAARWMARAGRDLLQGADLITPVPLHWTRRLKRRGNQAAELARALSRLAAVPCAPDLVTRTRRTPSQDGRNRTARQQNVSGAFRVSPRWVRRIAGARIVLVDDVLTTGATLSAMAEVLRSHGPKTINVLVLARVARDDATTVYDGENEANDEEN